MDVMTWEQVSLPRTLKTKRNKEGQAEHTKIKLPFYENIIWAFIYLKKQ